MKLPAGFRFTDAASQVLTEAFTDAPLHDTSTDGDLLALTTAPPDPTYALPILLGSGLGLIFVLVFVGLWCRWRCKDEEAREDARRHAQFCKLYKM